MLAHNQLYKFTAPGPMGSPPGAALALDTLGAIGNLRAGALLVLVTVPHLLHRNIFFIYTNTKVKKNMENWCQSVQ